MVGKTCQFANRDYNPLARLSGTSLSGQIHSWGWGISLENENVQCSAIQNLAKCLAPRLLA